MLKIPIDILQPGMTLAKPIIDNRGRTLLRHGVSLTDEYIAVLKQRNYSAVFITAEDTGDIFIEDTLSAQTYAQAQQTLTKVFEFVNTVVTEAVEADAKNPVEEAQIQEAAKSLQSHTSFQELETIVKKMLGELLNKKTLAGLSQIKMRHVHQYTHAVNVATTALLMGKCLYLNAEDLKRLGLGCLLHDIGKIFYSPALFEMNGRIANPKQYLRLREHTRLGYELLRSRNPDAVLVNHVALEHHERQDGRGYPRGLHGTNSIQRTRFDRDTILLISEIASIADVYDILSNPAPGRPSLTTRQLAVTLRQMAGTFLNKELVEIFLTLLPVLPVGANIQIKTGRYVNYQGVVVEANKKTPERPVIRLLFNPRKERITPIELNLASKDEITIEAVL